MDLSALRGFLGNGRAAAGELVRALHTLVAGLPNTALEGSTEDLARFRESILSLAGSLHEQTSSVELDQTVIRTLDVLRDYNNRAANYSSAKMAELKTVMRTMTDTITFLSESRTRSVHQLQFVEREMEQASQIDDIRLLRKRLLTCLDVVREESVRLTQESDTRSSEVRQQIDRAIQISDQPTRFGSMDSVTGLPTRRTAETVISDALEHGDRQAACVFVVKRLAGINTKYGRAVGDEVMLRVANHLAQHLSASSQLYRWSGPSFLALDLVKADVDDLKRAWSKAAALKQEISLDAKGRSVFVLIELAMHFQVASAGDTADELFRTLDKFVGEHAGAAGATA